MAETIESKVFGIIAEELGISEDDIALDSSFSDDLGTDTLDFMELIMAFEDEFEVEIDDNEAEKLKLVSDAVDFLSSRS